jgi:hypothetical protein
VLKTDAGMRGGQRVIVAFVVMGVEHIFFTPKNQSRRAQIFLRMGLCVVQAPFEYTGEGNLCSASAFTNDHAIIWAQKHSRISPWPRWYLARRRLLSPYRGLMTDRTAGPARLQGAGEINFSILLDFVLGQNGRREA